MSEIKQFDLGSQHQAEDYGFHQLAIAETAKCTDPKLADVQQTYVQALADFDKALKPAGASIETEQLDHLDTGRDGAYSGFANQVRNSRDHFDPDKAAIAHEVDLILRNYGNPNRLPYVEQNGVLHNLIEDLETFDAGGTPSGGGDGGGGDGDDDILKSAPAPRSSAGRLASIGAREWLDHLIDLNNQFVAAFAARNTARSTLVTGESKAARHAADAAYRAVVKRINALAEVNGDADYLPVINALNELIDRQRAVLAARQTHNANKSKNNPPAPGPDDDVLK